MSVSMCVQRVMLRETPKQKNKFVKGNAPNGEPGAAKTQMIQQKIDETVGIMRDNINRVADRGERLDVLQDKTENLSQSAQGFRRGANKVRKQMWWKDMKMKIILTIVVLILLTAIIEFITLSPSFHTKQNIAHHKDRHIAMEKAVRGATKPKSAAPKQKYLQVLLGATSDDELEEIFNVLHYRLREPSWSIVFKSLIVIHLLVRQVSGNRALSYLVDRPTMMNVSKFKDKSGSQHVEQSKNIHAYAAYLEERAGTYRELKLDFIKEHSRSDASGGRLRKLTVAKGLLREVKLLQRQLGALLKCKFFLDEVDNEVTLTAFRLLVKDLLDLFQVVNEGVINVLEQYIEMSLIDAKDALEIYRTFVKQTEGVVDYLSVAKKLQAALQMTIPNLKHAPVSLTVFLEEYINDPEFEKNRQEYRSSKLLNSTVTKKLIDNKATKTTTTAAAPIKSADLNKSFVSSENLTSNVLTTSPQPQLKEKEIIDYFSSIEKEQILIFGNQYGTGSLGHNNTVSTTNPFLAMQQQQQINDQVLLQQQLNQLTLQQQSPQPQPHIPVRQDTNPFRSLYSQSSMTNSTSSPIGTIVSTPQSMNYNPFQQQQQALSIQGTSISSPLNQTNPFTAMTTTSNTTTTIDNNQLLPLDSNPFRRSTRSFSFNDPQSAIATYSGLSSSSFPDSSTSSIVPYQPFHANTLPFRSQSQHRQSAANIFGAEY
ncbi:1530_t:CDS:10 [Ambispora leptoticha]|uniref:1530_t:CDS:1 n=1 Tax=Ambispora leptoticha TaxID=144679 RepID=A0A9N9B4T4_9GLOM|nr:1530_t:CDS:10 [Ambispora leptoticha]